MQALVLRHKATVGVTPLGIVIIHETGNPVLMGETPMSQTILDAYTKGVKVTLYDKTSCKLREYFAPPKNLDKFLDIGAKYFAFGSMTLEVYPHTGGTKIEIDGTSYVLKEIQI